MKAMPRFDIHPYLLTRQQAAEFLGVDPTSFDKYIRSNESLERFMVGKHERYTMKSLINFIESQSI
ncbi:MULTISPECIES: helix-turn-helix domain-containing protein [Clostridia]|uniref:helix-turn-helix domain-containing protein n=1 Tax=Clostridia TaxID=186801 RepID=UPI000EA1EA19|nr:MULTISPECIES: helix-turn-helix domain-containing protein [Clostridia]NBJ70513.1 DNA-binding protein [Roseburia sp. 1XD42-34]RKI75990.1 DNA-binding protein [Clostridium sp. 1xD42-85]